MIHYCIFFQAVKDNSTDSVFFVYYKKNKFFQGKDIREELCIDGFTVFKERKYTPVISGEVVGQKTNNLSAPVVLTFTQTEMVRMEISRGSVSPIFIKIYHRFCECLRCTSVFLILMM